MRTEFAFTLPKGYVDETGVLTVRGLGGRLSFEAWIAIAIGFLVNLWGMGATYFDWFA